jgi:inhibitor of cysteine peptidase
VLRQRNVRWSLLALLVAVLAVTGCGQAQGEIVNADVANTPAPEIVVDAGANGSRVELAKGQALAISLEANPSTGYSWEVAEGDQAVLRPVGEPQFAAQSGLMGAAGMETLGFEAAGTGQTTLKLVYHRPWEKDVEPLQTFSIEVVVK